MDFQLYHSLLKIVYNTIMIHASDQMTSVDIRSACFLNIHPGFLSALFKKSDDCNAFKEHHPGHPRPTLFLGKLKSKKKKHWSATFTIFIIYIDEVNREGSISVIINCGSIGR